MTTTAVPQPSSFTASFDITIYALHTASVGGMTGVIKKVEWTLTGSEKGQTFALPQSTDLSDPQPDAFIALEQVSEANVVGWIEGHETRLPNIKAHIQLVLDKEVARAALVPTPLPWLPAADTEQSPG